MSSTRLTIGGFTQAGVARSLIEMPSNSEKGLSHRFLWMFPKPLFGTFAALEEVNQGFTDEMCKLLDLSCIFLWFYLIQVYKTILDLYYIADEYVIHVQYHVLVKYNNYFSIICTCSFPISQTMEEVSTTDWATTKGIYSYHQIPYIWKLLWQGSRATEITLWHGWALSWYVKYKHEIQSYYH